MKLGVIILYSILLWSFYPQSGQTAEQSGGTAADWQISIKPKPTPEELEQERWITAFRNDTGIYAFDKTSLKKAESGKDTVRVLVKTTFTDAKVIDGLTRKYKEQLKPEDKVAYSEIQMIFQLRTGNYAITELKIVGKQGSVVEEPKREEQFKPVTPKTFAETMYRIVRNYTLYNADND